MLETCGYITVPVKATPTEVQDHLVNIDHIVAIRPSVKDKNLCYLDVADDYSVTARVSFDEVKRLIVLATYHHVRITGKTLDDAT